MAKPISDPATLAILNNNEPERQTLRPISDMEMGIPVSHEPEKERTITDALRDLLGGVARGSQNIATGILEGGEYLTRKGAERLGKDLGHPVNVPKWNAREFMGLEGENQIDLGKMIASKDPDAISMAIGEYAPSVLGAGPSILRQIAGSGLYGAASGMPGEKLKTGLTDALMTAALPAGAKYIPKAVRYLHPEKQAREFMQSLHGGTSQENLETLAQRIQRANESGKAEALAPKEVVMAEHGGDRIVPQSQKGSYLNIPEINKAYSANGELRNLHAEFEKNPTLEKADALKSAIGREKRFYEEQAEKKTIRDPGRRKLEVLKNAENSIQKDIDTFVSKLSPEKRKLYDEFRQKWAINAGKYDSKKNRAIRLAAQGNVGDIKGNGLINEFKGPLNERVQKVLGDIGSSGEGNILYSQLADLKPSDIEGLGERLSQLKQTGGMQRYIKPEHEALQQELMKRLSHRRYLTAAGLLGAGALGAELGYPGTGGTIAAGAIPAAIGKKSLSKLLAKLL